MTATRPKAVIMLAPGDVVVIAGKRYPFWNWRTTNTQLVLQVTLRNPDDPDGAITFTRRCDDLINVEVDESAKD